MWQDKAQKIVSELCMESYRRANYFSNGKKRKRHVPYSVPSMALDLLKCIKNDDEETAKAIMLRYTLIPESGMDY
jgi:hypothetical protein